MASTDERTGRPKPPPGDQPAPDDAGVEPGGGLEHMLGGGPESIPPCPPDPPFTIGGGLADAQAGGSLGRDGGDTSTADGAAAGSQPDKPPAARRTPADRGEHERPPR